MPRGVVAPQARERAGTNPGSPDACFSFAARWRRVALIAVARLQPGSDGRQYFSSLLVNMGDRALTWQFLLPRSSTPIHAHAVFACVGSVGKFEPDKAPPSHVDGLLERGPRHGKCESMGTHFP